MALLVMAIDKGADNIFGDECFLLVCSYFVSGVGAKRYYVD